MNFLVFGVLLVIHLVDSQKTNCISPISGSNGKCVQLKKCPHLYTKYTKGLVNNRITLEASNYLLKFAEPCNGARAGVVCCSELLPLDICGDTRRNNISNGNETDINEYKFMAVIRYESLRGGAIVDRCSGTLISLRYVLTAAHCINVRNHKLHSVILGEHTKKVDPDCDGTICAPPVQIIPIESFKAHPQYNTDTKDNDIALIRLQRPADFSKANVNPICLASSSFDIGEKLTATGWGQTEKDKQSDSLLQIDIDIVELGKCKQDFEGSVILTDKQFCAGSQKGVKACVGDSGGPSFEAGQLDDYFQAKYIQQGIVSFSKYGCAKNDAPNVFTRVSSFYDWILDNLEP